MAKKKYVYVARNKKTGQTEACTSLLCAIGCMFPYVPKQKMRSLVEKLWMKKKLEIKDWIITKNRIIY